MVEYASATRPPETPGVSDQTRDPTPSADAAGRGCGERWLMRFNLLAGRDHPAPARFAC
jgi:hypothetical protein